MGAWSAASEADGKGAAAAGAEDGEAAGVEGTGAARSQGPLVLLNGEVAHMGDSTEDMVHRRCP